MKINHFGIMIQDKDSNHISKEVYLQAKPEHMPGWKEENYTRQIQKANLNYDANMQFFASLDRSCFDSTLTAVCSQYKLTECFDLNALASVEGIYLLVLDSYKQIYVGISNDIKKRIQSHWRKRKSLERLIFGDVCTSVLSIDSFGPLDTTRIFYRKTKSPYLLENKLLNCFDPAYTLNRTAGGIGFEEACMDSVSSINMAIAGHRRPKHLLPYIDVQKLKQCLSESEFNYYLHKYPELRKPETSFLPPVK